MYRIIIKSSGKFNNARLGSRYCLTKKSAIHLINLFTKSECEIKVEKFVRLHADIFCWTDDDENDKVFECYYNSIFWEE